jgi:hypothetical protein
MSISKSAILKMHNPEDGAMYGHVILDINEDLRQNGAELVVDLYSINKDGIYSDESSNTIDISPDNRYLVCEPDSRMSVRFGSEAFGVEQSGVKARCVVSCKKQIS